MPYESAEQNPKHCLTPGFLIPLKLTHFRPCTENTVWVRKVRLVGKVQLATKALKFELPPEAEGPPEERRECE